MTDPGVKTPQKPYKNTPVTRALESAAAIVFFGGLILIAAGFVAQAVTWAWHGVL